MSKSFGFEETPIVALTKWNKNGFGNAINDPRKGKFSTKESQIVKKAIEDYCTRHGITPSRLCMESDNRTDHLRGAWMEISKSLPNRTVASIYRHGLRIMHSFKRGPWTEEETRELLTLVAQYGKKWAGFQLKLNRSADQCRDKYREFSEDYAKGKWSEAENQKLEMLIRSSLKVGSSVPFSELRNLTYRRGKNIPWSVISEEMKHRSRLACFKRFQQMTGVKHGGNKKGGSVDHNEVVKCLNKSFPISYNKVSKIHSVSAAVDGAFCLKQTRLLPCHQDSKPRTVTNLTPNPMKDKDLVIPDPTSEVHQDIKAYDRQMLEMLASSSFVDESCVTWSAIRYPFGAPLERWRELLDNFGERRKNDVDMDELLDLPIWEVAKMMLEKEAVETVDAIFG